MSPFETAEGVPLASLAFVFLILIAVAYFTYGAWIRKQLSLDDARVTPAHEKSDGVDYVPTKVYLLFAQHFSAIAAAGPIAGPILAVQMFGWLPAVLWIALGVVLIGAVHDFTSLTASVRHGAVSIAQIMRQQLGPRAGVAMMAFIWIALVYIIVAFTDITVGSFLAGPEDLKSTEGLGFNPGGAVAAASVLYLALSVVMGFVQRLWNPPDLLMTLIFVPLAVSCAWVGTQFSEILLFSQTTWVWVVMIYCAVASVLPVWSLLQPRGFLGGFMLYLVLGVGVIGILFGDFQIQQPAFKTWDTGTATGMLFPFLFVTIACGACSGFHGIVCSGTTSKQISKESHCHTVGYGAMLAEGFVALIAVVIVMMMAQEQIQGLRPGVIYGMGIGEFLSVIIGREYLSFAVTFGAMAFSTFVFDTLDVSARLGRYLFQELTGWRGRWGTILGTVLTCAAPLPFLLMMKGGEWSKFWTLFGASNQLLAAMTLLAVTMWLYKARHRIAFTLIPMLFVLVITVWALVSLTISNFKASNGFDFALLNSLGALSLLGLAAFLVITALLQISQSRLDSNQNGDFQRSHPPS